MGKINSIRIGGLAQASHMQLSLAVELAVSGGQNVANYPIHHP
jgi:hypothetical protein